MRGRKPKPSSSSSPISAYEQQRLTRITENRAKLQALGLPTLASSILPNQPQTKKTKKTHDAEYQPETEDTDTSSDDDQKSKSRRKGKQRISTGEKVGSTSCLRENASDDDTIDDDEALQQAISLSLGEVKDGRDRPQNSGSDVDVSGYRAKKIVTNIKGIGGRRNSRKESKSRVQLTEDEVVAYFFTFDEAGKGHISLRDLQRMVASHDFTWTDTEMAHMIHSFDIDGDGKVVHAKILGLIFPVACNYCPNLKLRFLVDGSCTPGSALACLMVYEPLFLMPAGMDLPVLHIYSQYFISTHC